LHDSAEKYIFFKYIFCKNRLVRLLQGDVRDDVHFRTKIQERIQDDIFNVKRTNFNYLQ
jgi:hypothetical protein